MKHTNEEIINALKVIKDECMCQAESCINCPFYFENTCYVHTGMPSSWKLNYNTPETWRAFK